MGKMENYLILAVKNAYFKLSTLICPLQELCISINHKIQYMKVLLSTDNNNIIDTQLPNINLKHEKLLFFTLQMYFVSRYLLISSINLQLKTISSSFIKT